MLTKQPGLRLRVEQRYPNFAGKSRIGVNELSPLDHFFASFSYLSPMTRLLILVLAAASPLFSQSYYNFRDGFLDRKGYIRSMDLVQTDSSQVTRTFDFLLRSTNDDSLSGRIRIPLGAGPFPAALLCVGIETGKEVIEMIEGQDSVVLLAANYPFEGEWEFKGWKALETTFDLRSMGFRTVPLLLNCLDWMFDQENVDKQDVTVVAVSFGVFTGIPAAVIDARVKQLVVVQAGGNLSGVIAHNSERWGTSVPSWLAGWLGGGILAPFEPNKYIPHLTPRKLVLVSSEKDSFFPTSSIQSLFDHAREPKDHILHQSGHVAPGERELIRELTNIVVQRIYGR
jgi:hypothetical protein